MAVWACKYQGSESVMSMGVNKKQVPEVEDSLIKVEDIIVQAVKLPIVRLNRASFLRKELRKYYPEEVVTTAIERNPAYAGVSKKRIHTISKQIINYETNKVAAISFAAGVPGGFAIAATIPVDLVQYFAFMLRAMQKLAFLYGFPEFDLNEDSVSDDTMNQIMVFLGVMFGVQSANAVVKDIAGKAAAKVSKSLANKALTKGVVYPVVKKIAQAVGVKMTRQIFADGVAKVVPVVGGFITGGLSYVSFKPCVKRLRNSFESLPLCDPEYYRKHSENYGPKE